MDGLGLAWLLSGFIGGLGFAYTCRNDDSRIIDRLMTMLFCVSIGVMCGFFALPGIVDAYTEAKEIRRETLCMKNS